MDSWSIEKWLQYVKNDLLVANALSIELPFVYRAVLTHAQQSVEKYLKAFILNSGLKFYKTHDLIILNKICENYSAGFEEWDTGLAWLSTVYTESRYPDDFEDIDKDDAQKALEIANSFEKFI